MDYARYFCCPGSDGFHLLRAALNPDRDLALQSWRAWRKLNTLEECDLTMHRLMPVIFRRFAANDFEGNDFRVLRGVYRYQWTRNTLFLNQARTVLTALREARIETLLLKGLSLLADDYADKGTRPMWDFDVLVRPDQREAALEVLHARGWKSQQPIPEISSQHGCELRNAQGQGLDLHWYCMDESRWSGADDDLWARSEEFSLFEDFKVRRLCAEHRFLHVCVHGAKASGDSLGWVSDAYHIASHHSLDYPAVLECARQRRVIQPLRLALGYLRDILSLPLPAPFVAQLEKIPVSLSDRLYFLCKIRYSHAFSFWAEPVLDYLRSTRRPTPLGFVRFLRHRWRLASVKDLPRHALGRVRDRLWRRRHYST